MRLDRLAEHRVFKDLQMGGENPCRLAFPVLGKGFKPLPLCLEGLVQGDDSLSGTFVFPQQESRPRRQSLN